MKFRDELVIAASPDALFAFLSDVERVATCLPGAVLESRDGDEYHGSMRVKVGPVTASFNGRLAFEELDADARRVVMRVRATEIHGQGDAEARITTEVAAAPGGSIARMDTELEVRGKVAQFGRGVLERVSRRMFAQFARNIERQVIGDGAPLAAAPAAPAASAATRSAAAPVPPPDSVPADGSGLALVPVRWRVAAAVSVWTLGCLHGYLLGRLRSTRA